MVSPLRQQLIEDLQLYGLSRRTQEMYVAAVKQLAGYYRKSPDQVSEEELRVYFLYLKNVRRSPRAHSLSPSAGSSSSSKTPCIGNALSWSWPGRPRRRSCPPCSLWMRSARSSGASAICAIKPACTPSIPAACASRKERIFRWGISTASAYWCTFIRARAAKIAMCPCRKAC